MTTSLALISNNSSVPTQQRSLLKAFMSNFTSEAFFSEIVSVALYPADFGNSGTILGTESIVDSIRSFLKDVIQISQKHSFVNYQQILKQAGIVSSILTIRESTAAIVTYENIYTFISPPDLAAKKIISNAINNKISTLEHFKDNLNNIVNIINAFNEIKTISNNLLLYDCLTDSVGNSTQSIFELMKSYRDLVISSYNDLSKLQILNKIDTQSDYFVLKNKETTKMLSKTLSTYISENYNFYKSGYELIDKHVHGLESSSVHIVTAPSNHGKSLFLVNLLRNIILNNIEEFEEGSAVVFVTLEDNIPKLTRRISSIFGNCKQELIGDLYREGSQKIKQIKKSNGEISSLQEQVTKIFDGILIKAIDNVTQFKTSIVLKYSRENKFSVGDLAKFIEQLRVTENLNVKLVVLDYIDCARPTIESFGQSNDYDAHGLIVQELRQLSINLNIPVLTATQNNRSSDGLKGEMTNALIGE